MREKGLVTIEKNVPKIIKKKDSPMKENLIKVLVLLVNIIPTKSINIMTVLEENCIVLNVCYNNQRVMTLDKLSL